MIQVKRKSEVVDNASVKRVEMKCLSWGVTWQALVEVCVWGGG